jgi:hypothetical protein
VATFWVDIDLDLTQAHLRTFDLTHCRVRTARFEEADFAEEVSFSGAQFTGDALFNGAQFAEDAWFDSAQFTRTAWFHSAQFTGVVWFDGARVASGARSVKLPAGWTTRAPRATAVPTLRVTFCV